MNDLVSTDFAAAWIAERDEMVAFAKGIAAVANDADLEVAGEIQTKMSKALKKLEAQRKAITAPLDDAKKQVMAQEKKLAAPLNEQLARLKALNTAYATEVARRVEAERREQERLEREAAEASVAAAESDPFGFNGEAAAPIAPVPVMPTTAMPRTSANRFVEKWGFEVTDANAVPREFLSVDEQKVRAFLAAKKAEGYKADELRVSGLRIFATMQVYGR